MLGKNLATIYFQYEAVFQEYLKQRPAAPSNIIENNVASHNTHSSHQNKNNANVDLSIQTHEQEKIPPKRTPKQNISTSVNIVAKNQGETAGSAITHTSNGPKSLASTTATNSVASNNTHVFNQNTVDSDSVKLDTTSHDTVNALQTNVENNKPEIVNVVNNNVNVNLVNQANTSSGQATSNVSTFKPPPLPPLITKKSENTSSNGDHAFKESSHQHLSFLNEIKNRNTQNHAASQIIPVKEQNKISTTQTLLGQQLFEQIKPASVMRQKKNLEALLKKTQEVAQPINPNSGSKPVFDTSLLSQAQALHNSRNKESQEKTEQQRKRVLALLKILIKTPNFTLTTDEKKKYEEELKATPKQLGLEWKLRELLTALLNDTPPTTEKVGEYQREINAYGNYGYFLSNDKEDQNDSENSDDEWDPDDDNDNKNNNYSLLSK